MTMAIETYGLTKRFDTAAGWLTKQTVGRGTAVADVSLAIEQGEIFGLLGPNGAGKTTLTKMLCTLILPTSGRAVVAGYPLEQAEQIRAATGLVVTDERSFYWRLSAYHNLKFFAALHGLFGSTADERIEQVLQDVGLTRYASQRFSNFSSGMKQRLAIARALLHQPQLLFLDEPSRSLDPTATNQLHALIAQLLTRKQVTIFLITHDLAEAEKLCQRVAVMHEGRVQVVGEPQTLRYQLQQNLRYVVRVGAAVVEPALNLLGSDAKIVCHEGACTVIFYAGEQDGRLTAVIDTLRHHNLPILSITSQPPTLEEVFQHFTQTTA